MAERHWELDLPDAFQDPAVLAFIATMMAWRHGDPTPPMPAGVTKESLPGLIAQLEDPKVRRAVVLELSVLVPHPDRKLTTRR